MSDLASAGIRKTILEALERRSLPPPGENEPLFSSGRLDSLAAAEVLLQLEAEHGIDLSDADFDISRIDTFNDLERLLASRQAEATAEPGVQV